MTTPRYARPSEWQVRQDIVSVCKHMYDKGYLAATDGNVSVRLGDRILITPSGVSKGHMSPEDLILTNMQGKPLGGTAKPSTEIAMHICAYEARPDVMSVVHGHPPRSIAFTVAGIPIPGKMLPEVVVTLGGVIPTVPYTTPGTYEVPEAIRPFLVKHDVIMMEWHGAICLGKDAMDAYYKMEKLEHLCEVALFAKQLGNMRELSPAQLGPLNELHQRMHAVPVA